MWHDSFDSPDKFFATGAARKTPLPVDSKGRVRITKGSMIAQRYGIGGKPWTMGSGRNGQKDWRLDTYFQSIGRPDSPALALDLLGHPEHADTFYSIGAPYIALASDWLPIATNWTGLMYMSVERNFGNLAEMYAMIIAVADVGIRPVMIDSLMISNVRVDNEAWPWIDVIPMDKGCDPELMSDSKRPLPTFLHYCQTYRHPLIAEDAGFKFSKYAVPDEKSKKSKSGMFLNKDGFLPEPDIHSVATTKEDLRNIFSHCFATRGTNKAARDYRRWYCEEH